MSSHQEIRITSDREYVRACIAFARDGLDLSGAWLDRFGLAAAIDRYRNVLWARDVNIHPTPRDVLLVLTDFYGLTDQDLPEVGTPEEVQALLDGRTELTSEQARQLERRFDVPLGAFLPRGPIPSSP